MDNLLDGKVVLFPLSWAMLLDAVLPGVPTLRLRLPEGPVPLVQPGTSRYPLSRPPRFWEERVAWWSTKPQSRLQPREVLQVGHEGDPSTFP